MHHISYVVHDICADMFIYFLCIFQYISTHCVCITIKTGAVVIVHVCLGHICISVVAVWTGDLSISLSLSVHGVFLLTLPFFCYPVLSFICHSITELL